MSEKLNLSGLQFKAIIFSAGVAALLYLGFFLWGGWQGVSGAMVKVGLPGIAIAMAMSLTNYSLRFLRWQYYLSALGHRIPWRPSFGIYLAGFVLTATPGRAGEVLRGVLLKKWDVPYPKSLAAYLSERLSDLLAIVTLTMFGFGLHPSSSPIILVSIGLLIIAFSVLSQARVAARLIELIPDKLHRIKRLATHLHHILIEAQRCHTPVTLIISITLGMLACISEAIAFYWILHWIGADIPLSFAIFVYAISILAGALSFMPGGLGGTEAVMTTLLLWKGIHYADAIAAVILIRLCTLWFSMGIGFIALTRSQSHQPPFSHKIN